jgi:hypothetical protein
MNQTEPKRVTLLAVSRWPATLAVLTFVLSGIAAAHDPIRENHRVIPYIDVIGPIGNRLPPGHRRKYNRPTYLGGKLMYYIAPSSLEAMSWHRAVHTGAYEKPKKHIRLEQHYFYPKPWEALKIGARPVAMQKPDRVFSDAEGMIEDLQTDMLESVEPELQDDSTPLPGPQENELELPDLQLEESAIETSSPSDA